ncbi:unnamed protein product [Urochloa humidicola]
MVSRDTQRHHGGSGQHGSEQPPRFGVHLLLTTTDGNGYSIEWCLRGDAAGQETKRLLRAGAAAASTWRTRAGSTRFTGGEVLKERRWQEHEELEAAAATVPSALPSPSRPLWPSQGCARVRRLLQSPSSLWPARLRRPTKPIDGAATAATGRASLHFFTRVLYGRRRVVRASAASSNRHHLCGLPVSAAPPSPLTGLPLLLQGEQAFISSHGASDQPSPLLTQKEDSRP